MVIKILFRRSDKAYLPEIDAYINYFNESDQMIAYDSLKMKNLNINDFDVIWEFMGFGGKQVNDRQLLIHEYASSSIGQLAKIKNFMKSKFSVKPDIRIFLNEQVKKQFYFKDNIKYCYRDMGVKKVLNKKTNKKDYDFVYIGQVSKERGLHKFLNAFSKKNNGTLVLVGNYETDLYDKYSKYENIIFTGKLSHDEVIKVASRCKYGINLIPDKHPYNIQTSTKLLEYLSLGLKIITTDYFWVNSFEKEYGLSFFKLDYNNMCFDKMKVEKYPYRIDVDMNLFLWQKILDDSNIKNIIISLYKKKKHT